MLILVTASSPTLIPAIPSPNTGSDSSPGDSYTIREIEDQRNRQLRDADRYNPRHHGLIQHGSSSELYTGEQMQDQAITTTSEHQFVIKDEPGSEITGGNYENESIVLINSPNSIIDNNVIENISGTGTKFGIHLINSPGTVVKNNSISDIHSTDNSSIGIRVTESNEITIQNNNIEEISTGLKSNLQLQLGTVGIWLQASNDSLVTGNSINSMTSILPFGILDRNSRANSIISNTITNLHANGDRVESAGIVMDATTETTIRSNEISAIHSDGITLSTSFGITITSSTNITVDTNSIVDVGTYSSDPNAFGIHAVTGSTGLEISRNVIKSIISDTYNYRESYSTGIYLADMNDTTITGNTINSIKNVGSAAYGIFLDSTPQITSVDNIIRTIISNSSEETQAVAYTIRGSPLFSSTNDTVSDISAQRLSFNDIDKTMSAIGYILDFSPDSSIKDSTINEVIIGMDANVLDSIGIIIHQSSYSVIQGNSISNLSAQSGRSSITLGLSISSSSYLDILNNTVSSLSSSGDIFGSYISGLTDSLLENNSFAQFNAYWDNYGWFIFLSDSLHMESNDVEDLQHKGSKSHTFELTTSNNITISNSTIRDSKYDEYSKGFFITGGTNYTISANNIHNKRLWIDILYDNIDVICHRNVVNGENATACEMMAFEPYIPPQDTQEDTGDDTLAHIYEFILLTLTGIFIIAIPLSKKFKSR